jgi:hypothetical protein
LMMLIYWILVLKKLSIVLMKIWIIWILNKNFIFWIKHLFVKLLIRYSIKINNYQNLLVFFHFINRKNIFQHLISQTHNRYPFATQTKYIFMSYLFSSWYVKCTIETLTSNTDLTYASFDRIYNWHGLNDKPSSRRSELGIL